MTSARILIVEADRIVARELGEQLERIGHTVVGTTARREEVPALIRALAPTLVLAAADLGALGCLAMPLDDAQLRTAIERALHADAADHRPRERGYLIHDVRMRPDAADPAPLPGPPRRVLVAEDDRFNSQLLEQLLASRGHAVRIAPDGRAALRAAISEAFDLLLLDLHMPELDGFQVLEALREHERRTGAHLPVIALTTQARAEDRARCFAAGADGFLAKPFGAVDLWSAIERATAKDGIPAAAEPGAAVVTPGVLLAAVGGNAAVLAVVRLGLTHRLPGALAELAQALDAGDAARVRDVAHAAAGMLAAFSTSAGAAASALEQAAATGDLEAARRALERLRELAPALLRELDGVTIESLEADARRG